MFFQDGVTMASCDGTGKPISDGCFSCVSLWSALEPGETWSCCCERSFGWKWNNYIEL